MVILIIQSVDSEEFSNVHFGSGHSSFRIFELFSTFDSFSAKSYQFIKQPRSILQNMNTKPYHYTKEQFHDLYHLD